MSRFIKALWFAANDAIGVDEELVEKVVAMFPKAMDDLATHLPLFRLSDDALFCLTKFLFGATATEALGETVGNRVFVRLARAAGRDDSVNEGSVIYIKSVENIAKEYTLSGGAQPGSHEHVEFAVCMAIKFAMAMSGLRDTDIGVLKTSAVGAFMCARDWGTEMKYIRAFTKASP